jgi:hypothetical protein
MKIRIDRPKKWFGPYQLAQVIMFWVPKEKDEYGFLHTAERVHKFGEWLAHGSIESDFEVGEIRVFNEKRPETWLYRFLKWIDKKRKRKVKVHIDYWDTRNMDETLSFIILPMLKQLKKNKNYIPAVDDEDVPESLRKTSTISIADEQNNIEDDNYINRWNWILDEMIFAFETKTGSLVNWRNQFTKGESEFLLKKIDEEGTYEIIKSPNYTEETNLEELEKYSARIQNGFRLFGKYYQFLRE